VQQQDNQAAAAAAVAAAAGTLAISCWHHIAEPFAPPPPLPPDTHIQTLTCPLLRNCAMEPARLGFSATINTDTAAMGVTWLFI
jgi:hypothetical protein